MTTTAVKCVRLSGLPALAARRRMTASSPPLPARRSSLRAPAPPLNPRSAAAAVALVTAGCGPCDTRSTGRHSTTPQTRAWWPTPVTSPFAWTWPQSRSCRRARGWPSCTAPACPTSAPKAARATGRTTTATA